MGKKHDIDPKPDDTPTITYDRNLTLAGRHLTLADLKCLVIEANHRGIHDSSSVLVLGRTSFFDKHSISIMEKS